VRSFPAFAAYLGHVLAIRADGPAAFAGDLALLFWVHSGEAALPASAALAGLLASFAALAPTSIGLKKPLEHDCAPFLSRCPGRVPVSLLAANEGYRIRNAEYIRIHNGGFRIGQEKPACRYAAAIPCSMA
jgi:hypothetical protein